MSSNAVANFLSGLPSRDPHNFQRFPVNSLKKTNITQSPFPYIPTKDNPDSQIIVNSKVVFFLTNPPKVGRQATKRGHEEEAGPSETPEEKRKRLRYGMSTIAGSGKIFLTV